MNRLCIAVCLLSFLGACNQTPAHHRSPHAVLQSFRAAAQTRNDRVMRDCFSQQTADAQHIAAVTSVILGPSQILHAGVVTYGDKADPLATSAPFGAWADFIHRLGGTIDFTEPTNRPIEIQDTSATLVLRQPDALFTNVYLLRDEDGWRIDLMRTFRDAAGGPAGETTWWNTIQSLARVYEQTVAGLRGRQYASAEEAAKALSERLAAVPVPASATQPTPAATLPLTQPSTQGGPAAATAPSTTPAP